MTIEDGKTEVKDGEVKGEVKAPEVPAIKPEDFTALQQRYDALNTKIGDMGRVQGEKDQHISFLTNQLTEVHRQIQESQAAKPAGPSPAEVALSDVVQQMKQIRFEDDPEGYESLQEQRLALVQEVTKEKVLEATRGEVKSILAEKDKEINAKRTQETEAEWLKQHSDFNTPEIQAAIKDVIAKNPIEDRVSAYHAVKAELTAAKVAELTAKIEEDQRLAELAEGGNETGKVVTGPGAGAQPKPKPIARPGTPEYMAGMKAAFNSAA